MMIVRFQGGLGNQMFQYAFLRSLQLRFPTEKVLADIFDYKLHDFHYGLELMDIFPNVKLDFASADDVELLSGYKIWKHNRILYKLYAKACKFLGAGNEYIRNGGESGFVVQNCNYTYRCSFEGIEYLNYDELYYFDGFWQQHDFYKDISQSIHEEFSFRNEDMSELSEFIDEINNVESVAVHVRRGDYVGSSFDILPRNYYERAFESIESKITNPVYYFFSEDEEYIREHFKKSNMRVVTCNRGVQSYRDMLLMSCCKHNIIANSSFSYWGAELNENPQKVVVAPDVSTPPIVYNRRWIKI